MTPTKNCSCGQAECWADGDYTWLDERAGWRGTVNGCDTVIHWVHGKKIAESRHLKAFSLALPAAIAHVTKCCAGLENPTIHWSRDTGDGDAGLWIVDVREPIAADWERLREARALQLQSSRRELAMAQKRIEVLQAVGAVDPQGGTTTD